MRIIFTPADNGGELPAGILLDCFLEWNQLYGISLPLEYSLNLCAICKHIINFAMNVITLMQWMQADYSIHYSLISKGKEGVNQ